MKPETLSVELDDLINMTKKGTQEWHVVMQTTEKMEESLKDVRFDEDGNPWIIDECYTDFTCNYLGNPFHLIAYENIQTFGDRVQSNNLLFMAPDGMRRFQLDYLAPYNVQNNQVLSSKLHNLWNLILEQYKKGNVLVTLQVSEPELSDMPNHSDLQ